jgi:hypothetical protein
VLLSFNYE